MLVAVALHEVDAGDLDGVVPVDAFGGGLASLQLTDRARSDDDGFQVSLLLQLLAPLIAEIGRAEHADAADFSAVEKLAGDEQGLDGLTDPDIVGDEKPDRV